MFSITAGGPGVRPYRVTFHSFGIWVVTLELKVKYDSQLDSLTDVCTRSLETAVPVGATRWHSGFWHGQLEKALTFFMSLELAERKEWDVGAKGHFPPFLQQQPLKSGWMLFFPSFSSYWPFRNGSSRHCKSSQLRSQTLLPQTASLRRARVKAGKKKKKKKSLKTK